MNRPTMLIDPTGRDVFPRPPLPGPCITGACDVVEQLAHVARGGAEDAVEAGAEAARTVAASVNDQVVRAKKFVERVNESLAEHEREVVQAALIAGAAYACYHWAELAAAGAALGPEASAAIAFGAALSCYLEATHAVSE